MLPLIVAIPCQGILAGATLQHLRSGHSHEDIDQVFGSLSLHLVKHGKCVETPMAFCDLIQKFCSTAHRPFEGERIVVQMDQHRPWSLDCADSQPDTQGFDSNRDRCWFAEVMTNHDKQSIPLQ